jgi:hypothetical protein
MNVSIQTVNIFKQLITESREINRNLVQLIQQDRTHTLTCSGTDGTVINLRIGGDIYETRVNLTVIFTKVLKNSTNTMITGIKVTS